MGELEEKNDEQQHHISNLRKEISKLLDIKAAQEEKIEDLHHQNKNLNHEINNLKYNLEATDREKGDLVRKVRSLNEDLSLESQRLIDQVATVRREETEKLENEINEKMKL